MMQTLLMKAFKKDKDNNGVLYNWMKWEYIDVCSIGDGVMHSLIENYKEQKMATEEDLEWVIHLYKCYVFEYLREKNGLARKYV